MRRVFQAALGLALAAAIGCGSSTVEVDGKVTKGAEPYTLAEGETINIVLTGDKGTVSLKVEQNGTFSSKAEGNVIPVKPGSYKVSVVHYPPVADKGAKKGMPSSSNKSAGETWEVSGPSKSFTLDMNKYKTEVPK